MTFFNTVTTVLSENPEDFAQAVFSRTGFPQESKYLFILMLLNDMLDAEMRLTEHGEILVRAVCANEEADSHLSALMRFMCEDAEFAKSRIEPVLSAHVAAGEGRITETPFWRSTTEKLMEEFPDHGQLVRMVCHVVYADTFQCSFNEAAERLYS